MNEYICQHCGATLHLLMPPNRHRVCPNCGRHLRVCENCQFFDLNSCMHSGTERFTALHGNLCNQFQFRLPVPHKA